MPLLKFVRKNLVYIYIYIYCLNIVKMFTIKVVIIIYNMRINNVINYKKKILCIFY